MCVRVRVREKDWAYVFVGEVRRFFLFSLHRNLTERFNGQCVVYVETIQEQEKVVIY